VHTKVGLALRTLRLRRGWRQVDLARASGISRWRIGRIERDRVSRTTVGALEALARALDADLELTVRWNGAQLDRLINRRHAVLHEAAARLFEQLPGWEIAAEVSFSIYGERGIIDLVGYHAASAALLIIELKTELVDPQELVGSVDRKVRLGARIARERGWQARTVSGWVICTEGRTNRRHVDSFSGLLRSAFPADGHAMRAWLASPRQPIRALSFLSIEHAPLRDQLPVQRRRASPARNAAAATPRTVI